MKRTMPARMIAILLPLACGRPKPSDYPREVLPPTSSAAVGLTASVETSRVHDQFSTPPPSPSEGPPAATADQLKHVPCSELAIGSSDSRQAVAEKLLGMFAQRCARQLENHISPAGIVVVTRIGLPKISSTFASAEAAFAHWVGQLEYTLPGAHGAVRDVAVVPSPHTTPWTGCRDELSTEPAAYVGAAPIDSKFVNDLDELDEAARRTLRDRIRRVTFAVADDTSIPITLYLSITRGRVFLELIETFDPCSA